MGLIRVKRDFKRKRGRDKVFQLKRTLYGLALLAIKKFKRNFVDQKDPDGSPWKIVQRKVRGTQAFNRATRNQRRRKILYGDTGKLRKDIEIEKIEGNTITIVADAEYSGYHNDGTDRLPQRQFMGHNKEIEDAAMEYIDNEMEKIIHDLL